MADNGSQQRELVYCHACANEWYRDQHGLKCPSCASEVVEIIEERSDPRHNHIDISDDEDEDTVMSNNDDRLPHNPLHRHNPWRDNAPDPDEPDIEHVEWNPAPGVHFARTSFRSTGPGTRPRPQDPNDIFAPLFQSFSTILEGAANAGRPPLRDGPPRAISQIHRPAFPAGNPFPEHQHHHIHHHHGPWDGPQGGRSVFTATGRWPPNGPGPFPNDRNGQNVQNVLATLLQTMQAGMAEQRGQQTPVAANLPAFIAQMLGNGPHGDAVFSDEALDRIITQMMEQTNTNSAPGPASAAAIAALPKKQAEKSMMGQDGKAECSVCMDAVEIGDEVTVLPCNHWFHGDCVGAWLKEHDTCPHCRQGIMPKDGPEEADAPRSPGQAPRHSINPFMNPIDPNVNPGTPPSPGSGPTGINNQPPMPGAFIQPGMQQPYVPGGYPRYPEPTNFVRPPGQHQGPYSQPPSPQQQQGHRRRSAASQRNSNGGEGSSGGGGQGVTGWFRNLRGGNGGNR